MPKLAPPAAYCVQGTPRPFWDLYRFCQTRMAVTYLSLSIEIYKHAWLSSVRVFIGRSVARSAGSHLVCHAEHRVYSRLKILTQLRLLTWSFDQIEHCWWSPYGCRQYKTWMRFKKYTPTWSMKQLTYKSLSLRGGTCQTKVHLTPKGLEADKSSNTDI